MSKYLTTPYIPDRPIASVLVDYRTPIEIKNNLREHNIKVYQTCCCSELYEAIQGHGDIVFHMLSGNEIVVAPNVYDYYFQLLSEKGFSITKGAAWLNKNYPENIAYNVLRIGKIAFHNTKYTDKIIVDYFEKNDIKLVHINQGYSKCSVCIINEKSIITSDRKIIEAAEKHGIEGLFIEPGDITLPSLNYGFVGGSSGLLAENIISFTGKIKNNKTMEAIESFAAKYNLKTYFLSELDIIDIGSVIPLF